MKLQLLFAEGDCFITTGLQKVSHTFFLLWPLGVALSREPPSLSAMMRRRSSGPGPSR